MDNAVGDDGMHKELECDEEGTSKQDINIAKDLDKRNWR